MSAQSDDMLEKIINIALLGGWQIGGPLPLVDWLTHELVAAKLLRRAQEQAQSDLIRLAAANFKKGAP